MTQDSGSSKVVLSQPIPPGGTSDPAAAIDWDLGPTPEGEANRRLLSRAAREHWDTPPHIWERIAQRMAHTAIKSRSTNVAGNAVRVLLLVDKWNTERVTALNWSRRQCECVECIERRKH